MRPASRRSSVWSLRAWFVVLAAVLVVTCLASLGVGASHLGFAKVASVCWDGLRSLVTGAPLPDDADHTIVLQMRLARILLGCLVGAALALSGTLMQALFQNPMADPYLLGVSAGASLGAVIALTLGVDIQGAGLGAVSVFAFCGALLMAGTVYVLSLRGGRVHTATLLLTGIALGALVASLTSLVIFLHDRDAFRVLVWLMGGLSWGKWQHVLALAVQLALCAGVSLGLARTLNLLLMGDEEASNLGVNVALMKKLFLALASLAAAAAVAVSGIIGFVGLLVPHLCRLGVGSDHRRLIPFAMLAGALLLVAADAVARVVIAPGELPIGILTSALGCPFFIYLLRKQGGRA